MKKRAPRMAITRILAVFDKRIMRLICRKYIKVYFNSLFQWRIHIPFHEAQFAETMYNRDLENAQSIGDAAAEIDAGGFCEIAGRASDLGDLIAQVDDLGEHLVIEYEVFGIDVEVDALEDLAGEGAIAGMIFGDLLAQHYIFEECEHAVEDIFIEGHATCEGTFAEGTCA